MKFMRYALVAVLLLFSWKGATLDFHWPPAEKSVVLPRPSPDKMKWAEHLRGPAAKMSPVDRVYLSRFYDAMGFVLSRDFNRPQATRVIKTTDNLISLHGGSLNLAIDRKDVGKYPGLAEGIDIAFLNALGADPKAIEGDAQQDAIDACAAISYTLGIGTDE